MKLSLSNSMAYRANFLLHIIASVTFTLAYILYFKYLVASTGNIGGFDFADLLILQAFGQLWFTFHMVIAHPTSETTINNIIKGDFDFYLVKPINSFFLSTVQSLKVPLLILLLPYTVFLIFGLQLKQEPVSFSLLILSIFALIFGIITTFFFQIAFTTIGFYFKDIKESIWRLISMQHVDNYPNKIYPTFIRLIGFSVIPYFFISNVPVYILIGEFKVSFILLSFLATVIWGFIAIKLWNRGTRYYDSASS